MTQTVEMKLGYEPPLEEVFNDEAIQAIMRRANVTRSHVEAITDEAAERLRGQKGASSVR